MADISCFSDLKKPVAILGLGVSGRAVADACAAANVPYHGWDENKKEGHDFTGHLEEYAFLVPSAGIAPSHPVIAEAVAKNIPLHSDVDLLLQSAPDATVIAVTGTNGKSTTTALIAHILKAAGKNVAVGGNLGQAACSLPSLGADGIYVIEMSSYMLYYSANAVADIAVFLNITPDHQDWHGSMAHYKNSKERIFRQRDNRPPQVKIYGLSMGQTADTYVLPDHEFLKGAHNHENRVAALEACRACGLDDATILHHMQSFGGLPHRQKRVTVIGDVQFINDSKGTNPDATSKALSSFENMFWIVGGQATADKLSGLEQFYPKIRHAYLIGEAQDEFAGLLNGVLPYTKCGVMAKAVEQAFVDARKSGDKAVVLLSPACKSWDQYKNYEERGLEFEALSLALATKGAAQ